MSALHTNKYIAKIIVSVYQVVVISVETSPRHFGPNRGGHDLQWWSVDDISEFFRLQNLKLIRIYVFSKSLNTILGKYLKNRT